MSVYSKAGRERAGGGALAWGAKKKLLIFGRICSGGARKSRRKLLQLLSQRAEKSSAERLLLLLALFISTCARTARIANGPVIELEIENAFMLSLFPRILYHFYPSHEPTQFQHLGMLFNNSFDDVQTSWFNCKINGLFPLLNQTD